MSSAPSQPELSLQARALVNRLQARLGSGIADLAASLLAAAEAAPLRASREWQLFWGRWTWRPNGCATRTMARPQPPMLCQLALPTRRPLGFASPSS